MTPEEHALELLRGQLSAILPGIAFLLFGLAAASIAAIRRRSRVRILLWLAIWSGMYGVRLLTESSAFIAALPRPIQTGVPYVNVVIAYLLVVFASLAWLELALGELRTFLKFVVFAGTAIGLAGIGWFVVTGRADTFILYNNLLTLCGLLILLTVVAVKKLSDKFLVLPNRGVLAAGTLVFAVEAVYVNFSRFFHHRTLPILDSAGFAVLLASFAFVAARILFTNERRLLSIENELATARQIQFSILPAGVPELTGLSVAAAYYPMTAVAGDFYDFLQIDEHRVGFFMADVSGHGVPAALIASMLKVATRFVAESASDPAALLGGLNRIFSDQLHNKFVTAAYLLVDLEAHRALYSAAGHPPLLHWDSAAREVRPIESNGLLFGVLKEEEYPVREIPLKKGDRFLLYTDGLTEAENSAGEAFGDRRLGEVVRSNENVSAEETGRSILAELRLWQHAQTAQQDDITWIIIDVL
jgi:phosphoserine phosphatase RsbU/P